MFLGSNSCLFILIPFAYFFSEAEGFSGSRKVSFRTCLSQKSSLYVASLKGILPRVYESIVLLILLVVILGGLVWLGPGARHLPLLTDYQSWLLYIPLLYSFISLIGILLLCGEYHLL